MKTIISLCASLLLLATVGCKKTENVKTTSFDTTVTVTETRPAPVTDSTTSLTIGPATPPATASEPAKSSAKPAKPQTKSGGAGQPATETVGSTTSKSAPPPAKTAPPVTETKPSVAPAPSPSPAPTSNASLASTGQSIFKSQCVSCHGADASGNTAMGRKNNIPDFRSSAVQGRSDADLANVIANGIKPLSASAHKSKHLSSDQVKALVAYVRSLK